MIERKRGLKNKSVGTIVGSKGKYDISEDRDTDSGLCGHFPQWLGTLTPPPENPEFARGPHHARAELTWTGRIHTVWMRYLYLYLYLR